MYFDTHAHYDDAAFDPDRDAVLADLAAHDVVGLVTLGCDVPSSRAAIALADQFDFVYAAVGIHPENCAGVQDADFETIRALAAHDKVKAIGEIGLDYYWPGDRDVQKAVLRRQMDMAQALDLPVVIHDRDAHGDTMAILREFPAVRGELHCYSGGVEDARELLRRGWYLGFGGAVTFKNARRAPEVLAIAPLERLLLETDCPYLAPVPFRGKRNDSRLLPYMAAKIAEIKGIDPEIVAQQTTSNAKVFFGIDDAI
ncbi:MAG: TatD family hydrolase [Oscillospiraceae bacterium]|nr:TatD family hydrolase [Oscillospiraceae bacterium]